MIDPETIRNQRRIVVLAHRATLDATAEVKRIEAVLAAAKRTQAQCKAYENDQREVEQRLLASDQA